MSFDNLITIGIIIYVIYSIKKVFSSGEKEGDATEKSSGWAGKLGVFVDNIKTEIEKANQHAMPDNSAGSEESEGSFWEGIREPSTENLQSESKTISQTPLYETKTLEAQPFVEKEFEIPEVPEESHLNYEKTKGRPIPVPGKRKANRFKMRKSNLKNAVVWSEILSQPVGLRDEA